MEWWQALILGIVEGLTEYLPVSSTGHLILVQWACGLGGNAAVNSFNIVIQAGAIAAVLGLYRGRVAQMLRGVAGRDQAGRRLAIHLILAFLPAAALGPLLADRIDAELFRPWPVIAALGVGGVLMLAVAWKRRHLDARSTRDIEDIGWKIAVLIGLAQCVAMWPGTSRSMMTIVAAMLLGLRAKAAAEFSFLLGLLTLSAATLYAGAKGGGDMIDQLGWLNLAIGFVAATVSAALAVHWFVAFLTRRGLAPFGWYRLALTALLAGLILAGIMPAFTSPKAGSPKGPTPPAPAVEPPQSAVADRISLAFRPTP